MTLYVGRLPERTRRRRARVALVAAVVLLSVAVAVLVQTLGGLAARGSDTAQSPTGVATGVDPELQRRFAVAQEAAAADGVMLTLTSGGRSAADQQAIVDDAVEKYGSLQEARRWVLPPESSAHVQGLAIDVGPTCTGALWLGDG